MSRDVLVVDDDVPFANGIVSALNAHGHRAQAAYDGDQALEQLSRQRFDVVISDIVMPGMIGCTLVQAAHAIPGRDGIPFVFMSVLNESKVKSFFDTAIRYLQKPFQTRDLLETVEQATSGHWAPDPIRATGSPPPGMPQRRAR